MEFKWKEQKPYQIFQESSSSRTHPTYHIPLSHSPLEEQTQQQGGGHGFKIRVPGPHEERGKLVVAVTNNEAGRSFLDSLRENQERLGFIFEGTLGTILHERNIRNAGRADDWADLFAFLEIAPGFDFPVINRLLHHACTAAYFPKKESNISIEPNFPMEYSGSAGLQARSELRSRGSQHDQYMNMLSIPQRQSSGAGVKIAVIDSGFSKKGVLRGFFDL